MGQGFQPFYNGGDTLNQIYRIIGQALKNFDPRYLYVNPVMFVTEFAFFVAIFVAIFPSWFNAPSGGTYTYFYVAVIVNLFLTLFFSNTSVAISESKSKAITDSLKKLKQDVMAKVIVDGEIKEVHSSELRKGDKLLIEAGDIIPIDGEIIEGTGFVNESNVTGESRPSRKIFGDSVTGSTKLVTDSLKIVVTNNPGETFLDKMISIVGSSKRSRTPNEISLTVFLSGVTLIFLIVVSALFSAIRYIGLTPDLMILIVLLISLIPTTIGGLLPAIGVASINKISEYNVIAKSGKAIENAGDIDTIILDKTGTVTMGEREAVKFYPNKGIDYSDFVRNCAVSSIDDLTKEGMSIVKLAEREGVKVPDDEMNKFEFVPFSAETKSSGVKSADEEIFKGALKAIEKKYSISDIYIEAVCKEISLRGGTALVVVKDNEFSGVIELNDMLKPGIKQRLERLKKMNIKTIMCTGDDETTAAYISQESGIDEYVANSTPMDKYNVVLKEKEQQRMVAMVGDGTNDAPALSRADVGLAMNNGTQAAKDAANMVDLDNDPTKLMDVIFLGKQVLITRGALSAFSVANDLSKYFVIVPAMFTIFPELDFLNILNLQNPIVAITAAIIFNTLIILLLIPMAIRGVRYRPTSIGDLLRRNVTIYGIGGIVLPFILIKVIYSIMVSVGVTW